MTAPSGLLIIDKPGGLTSHDVVARIRRIAGTRRVGHAGTLDPMATGVLVIGIEKATRLLGHLMLTEKTYEATIRLGQSTSTDDAEGEPTGGSPATAVTRAAVDAEIGKLTGEIMQVPPGVSAIKVNGQRAYKLTRAGAAPELKPRPVTVYEFTVTAIRPAATATNPDANHLDVNTLDINHLDVNTLDADHPDVNTLDIDAVIRCSSGTYIRALARDLGQALGTGGHLTALRRTSVGPYGINESQTLDEVTERMRLLPIEQAAAAAFQRVHLSADSARRLAQGAQLPAPSGLLATQDHPAAAFAPDGTLVALVTADAGRLRSLAVFASPAS